MDRARVTIACSAWAAALSLALPAASARAADPAPYPHMIAEGYPVPMAMALAAHRAELKAAASVKAIPKAKGYSPYALIQVATDRWDAGSTVRVAFRGGTPALYKQIESAVQPWTAPGVANLRFSFRNAAGAYNTWTPGDTAYAAEVRIGFDQAGFWSAVGKDSIDRTLPGGRPGEASMNFQGFDTALPSGWEGMVRHEFGHALGFQHEHRSPTGACDFRYFDDPGYHHSKDEYGWYMPDPSGARPGLYTYFGGKSNYWSKAQVDYAMKPITDSSAYAVGPFDRLSIMKYYFEPFEFASGDKSPCYTGEAAQNLSAGDIAGASQAYPANPGGVHLLITQNAQLLKALQAAPGLSPRLKSSLANRMTPAMQ